MADTQHYDITHLKLPPEKPDFIIDGIHFGRGKSYINEMTSEKLNHETLEVKCWKIVEKNLSEIDEKSQHMFYSFETYIIRWCVVTRRLNFKTNDVLNQEENNIYFYWKGEDAAKGYSPLPESIERENPPVERIVQWSEPPVFLHLFSGRFIVHKNEPKNEPQLYILRGELENEVHLNEVELKRENLRSRTSFVLSFPKEKKVIIWHGSKSSSHCRKAARKITEADFGLDFIEVEEAAENEKFLNALNDNTNYFVHPKSKIIDYTPRLFYFNQITGSFATSEIQCSHQSDLATPFPFLQSHLYTAEQPAIFLLDDNDEIWIWYVWNRDDNEDFKSNCFIVALNYAKQKSKSIQKLVKVHKVIAGFEPITFTNLFPVWKKHDDVVEIQTKDGVLQNLDPLIEIVGYESDEIK